MDGLLVESESRWRQAEREVCHDLGLSLTDVDFDRTMGVRMREVAELWFQWEPWTGPSTEEVAHRVTDRVVELCQGIEPLPGVLEAIELFALSGLRLAVCSSSDLSMIKAILTSMGLAGRFEVVHSAENDAYGKPHPLPYLETAAELGLDPKRCVALEDSVAGTISAKAAGMRVVSVPDPVVRGSAQFGIADVVLESLTQLDHDVVEALATGTPVPTLSRPRFHLAFSVDDLAKARWFYGEVLGCREGRSNDLWVDFDLWGHQVVAHLAENTHCSEPTNEVDGHQVPAVHFGLVLPFAAWRDLAARLKQAGVRFIMEPTVRFTGGPGQQSTFFVEDPAGNALEFKSVLDDRTVFALDTVVSEDDV